MWNFGSNVEFWVKCGFVLVKCEIFGQKNQFIFSRLQIRPDDYSSTLIQRLFNNLLRKMRSAQKISTHKSLVVKLVKVRFRGHDAKKRIPFFQALFWHLHCTFIFDFCCNKIQYVRDYMAIQVFDNAQLYVSTLA